MLSCDCSLKELPEADKQMIWQLPCPMSSCGSGCLRAVLPPGQADSNAKVCLHDRGNEHCAVSITAMVANITRYTIALLSCPGWLKSSKKSSVGSQLQHVTFGV